MTVKRNIWSKIALHIINNITMASFKAHNIQQHDTTMENKVIKLKLGRYVSKFAAVPSKLFVERWIKRKNVIFSRVILRSFDISIFDFKWLPQCDSISYPNYILCNNIFKLYVFVDHTCESAPCENVRSEVCLLLFHRSKSPLSQYQRYEYDIEIFTIYIVISCLFGTHEFAIYLHW